MWREKRSVHRLYDFKHWSERTVIALVMQTVDNSITTYTKRSRLTGRRRLTSRQGHGIPNPTWIPVANDAVRRMARIVKGTAGGSIGEPFNRPMTAHFIGGCTIGDSPETGVVDGYQRVYGYPGLHVIDGSAISANLGVNPSLTITAQAERAVALWPNKGRGRRPPGARRGLPTARTGRAEEPGRPGACARGPPPAHRRNPLTVTTQVIVLNGGSSSGKTTIARRLQEAGELRGRSNGCVHTCGPRRALGRWRCGADVAAAREKERGDRTTGMAASQATLVHEGVAYDLVVDTSRADAEECARLIAGAVA